MSFIREFSPMAIEALKEEPLFRDHLLADIVEGKPRGRQKKHSFVFPAVRNGRIDFYWGGGKLFSYKQSSGFTTHHKYASVLVRNKKDDYVPETSLQKSEVRLIKDFSEGYERIKENCERYSRLEALGVSSLYERFSCARNEASSVVVLDIEASFAKDEIQEQDWDESHGQDRIDIVSLDMESKMIRFIEAKHYSNHDSLRAEYPREPKVVAQIEKYKAQIVAKEAEILEAYQNHVQVINALFSKKIPKPLKVDTEPILLIFGFDKEQRDWYLKPIIENPLKDKGLRVYSIGDIKKSDLSVVHRGGEENW